MRKFSNNRLLLLSVLFVGASMLIQNVAMGIIPAASTGGNPASTRSVTSADSGRDINTNRSISTRGENLNRTSDDDTDTPNGQWRPGVRGPKRHYEEVMPGQLPCSGREMLYREHVDATYATYDKGKLAIKLVDGSDVRDASEVCLRLPVDADSKGDEISRIVVPQGKQWRFLGNPGAIVWYAPQANDDGSAAPIWAGLGAFDNTHEWQLPKGVDQGLVTLRLTKVITPSGKELNPKKHDGKEQLNIFALTTNSTPDKMISTNMGIWEYKAGVGSHTHANWTFSAPGYWQLYWEAEMSINGQKQVSPVTEQIWAVGTNLDVMLKGQTMEGTKPVSKTAENIRDESGLKQPADNGFDYIGEERKPDAYTPADSLDKLVPPNKPALPKKLDDASDSSLKAIYSDEFSSWSKRAEFNAKNYLLLGFNDSATVTDNTFPNTRLRLFNEKTSDSEKKQVFTPLVPSEANNYYPTEPVTDNTYYVGESDKIIPVPDQYLTAYGADTFKDAGEYKEHLNGGQVYAFDQRDPQSPRFSISLPADKEGLIKDAVVYIDDQENETKVAWGIFTTDANTGKDVWKTAASGVESNRRSFILKPGETKPLSLIFNKPGVAKVNVNYQINYRDNAPGPHPGPVESDFRFLVGSKTINLWRDWDAQQGAARTTEREKVTTAPRPSIGYYAQYKADLAKYKAKKAELEKKPSGGKKQDLGLLYRQIRDAETAKNKLSQQIEGFLSASLGTAGATASSPGGLKYSPANSSLLGGWSNSTAAKKDKAASASEDKEDVNAATNSLPASISGADAISSAKTAATTAHSPLIWMLIGAGVMATLIGLGMIGYVLLAGRKR